ncbi:hypothetical protein, partial [uncultured Adlercreutzia sp.]|uniref:hypothetical protein n=1 Tax=uncultured Adlercreutzia sp. TaxID=875803 RepID=UPI0026F3FE4C
MDASNTVQEVNVTWAELKAAGRVSGPWKISDTDATIVYDENGNPTYDADGDYVIDFESFFRSYTPPAPEPEEPETPEEGEGDGSEGEGGADGDENASSTTFDEEDIADEPMALEGEAVIEDDGATVTDENIISYSTYKATDATNTNTINGFAGDDTVDHTYAKALFTELEITFEATNANRRFPNTVLDAGQWLTRRSQNNVGTTAATAFDEKVNTTINYAFKYDGIYVDRPVELFTTARAATNTLTHNNLLVGTDDEKTNAGNYDYESTPTFGKQASGFAGTDSRHRLTVNLKAKDPNTEGLTAFVDATAAYRVAHKLGTMNVDYVRGRKIAPIDNGTSGTADAAVPAKKDTVFAYDADDRSSTSIFSYEPTTTANDIPDGALYAGDYVEYTLYVGANATSILPLQHVDARFWVQKGQRIVGWEVLTEDEVQKNSVGANDEIGVTEPFGTDVPQVNTANPNKTTDPAYYDPYAKAARVTAKLLGEPVDGQQTVTMANAPASTDLTTIAHDTEQATVTGMLGAAAVDAAATGEYYSANRGLVFSVGSSTQQMLRGEGVYIRVIT